MDIDLPEFLWGSQPPPPPPAHYKCWANFFPLLSITYLPGAARVLPRIVILESVIKSSIWYILRKFNYRWIWVGLKCIDALKKNTSPLKSSWTSPFSIKLPLFWFQTTFTNENFYPCFFSYFIKVRNPAPYSKGGGWSGV